MVKNKQIIWLDTAYKQFAEHGKFPLKIDLLAFEVNKSRSSFYHLFGDLEEFWAALISYHFMISDQFAQEAYNVEKLRPDFTALMTRYKDMIFFQKSLLSNRFSNPQFEEVFIQVRKLTENISFQLWKKDIGLDSFPDYKVKSFFYVVWEALLSRIQYDLCHGNYLQEELESVNKSLQFLQSEIFTIGKGGNLN